MSNTNDEHLGTIKNTTFYVNPAFYTDQPDEDIPMTLEEEAKFMESIDTEALDKIIDYLETQIDNPAAWVSWEEVKERLWRYD